MIQQLSDIKQAFCFVCLLLYVPNVCAQLKVDTETLKRICADANARNLDISHNGIVQLGELCPGKQIRVVCAGDNLLDVGMVLFHPSMDKSYAPAVYDFIERYFLSLLLKRTQAEQLYLLREDFVTVNLNGKPFQKWNQSISNIVRSIQEESPFTLLGEPTQFRAIWMLDEGRTVLELCFPKQYDLIYGQDKKEIVRSFTTWLSVFEYTPKHSDISIDFLTYNPELRLFVEQTDYYQITQVSTGRYIQQKGDRYTYLFNERQGRESLTNLFLHADEMDISTNLIITIKGYQYADTLEYSLERLCAYMNEQHCEGYIGFETNTASGHTGTVYFVNRDLMYKHLLYFEFPTEAFKHSKATIKAQLYPFIPINNLANMFDDRPSK